jgi:hypothetical protein
MKEHSFQAQTKERVMIRFRCFCCGHWLTVADTDAGMQTRCPQSGLMVPVPSPVEGVPAEQIVDEPLDALSVSPSEGVAAPFGDINLHPLEKVALSHSVTESRRFPAGAKQDRWPRDVRPYAIMAAGAALAIWLGAAIGAMLGPYQLNFLGALLASAIGLVVGAALGSLAGIIWSMRLKFITLPWQPGGTWRPLGVVMMIGGTLMAIVGAGAAASVEIDNGGFRSHPAAWSMNAAAIAAIIGILPGIGFWIWMRNRPN